MKKPNQVNTVLLLAICAAITTTASASSVTIPNTFTSGTAAVAAEVNENFAAIKSAVDDNNNRISAFENGYISVSSHAFRNEDAVAPCLWNTTANISYGYYESGGSSTCDAVAAIQLPHNATATSLTCYFYDNDATTNVFGRLYRKNLSSVNSIETIFSTPSTTDTVAIQILNDTTASTPGIEVIDNQNYAYHISLFFGDTDTADINLRAYGCTVEYQ